MKLASYSSSVYIYIKVYIKWFELQPYILDNIAGQNELTLESASRVYHYATLLAILEYLCSS